MPTTKLTATTTSTTLCAGGAAETGPKKALCLLRNVFATVDLTQKVLMQAMDAGLADCEDAIQYFSAVHAGADFMIARNAEDFPRTGPTVMPPGEWLAILPE